MPIRTPRGRRIILRPVGNAIMWSWRHLIVAALLFFCTLALIVFLIPNDSPRQITPPATTSVRPTELPKVGAPPAAREAAEKWAKAWINPRSKPTPAAWLKGLQPYTSEELLGTMDSIDPDNVPTRITGPFVPKSRFSIIKVIIEFPTEQGAVRLTLVNEPPRPYEQDTWLVHDYDAVE